MVVSFAYFQLSVLFTIATLTSGCVGISIEELTELAEQSDPEAAHDLAHAYCAGGVWIATFRVRRRGFRAQFVNDIHARQPMLAGSSIRAVSASSKTRRER